MLKIRKMMKKQQGFTLIELIVVIAILGVLSALIVPRFVNTASNAKETAAEATVKTLQSAVELYKAENNIQEDPSWETLVTEKYIDENPNSEENAKKFGGTFSIDGNGKVIFTSESN